MKLRLYTMAVVITACVIPLQGKDTRAEEACPCPASPCTKKVCIPTAEVRKIDRRVYNCVCEDFCLPKCSLCGAGHGGTHKEACPDGISVPCGRCGHPRTRKYLVVRTRPEERPENRCAVVQVPTEPKCKKSLFGWLGHSKSLSTVSPVFPPDLEVSSPLQPPISVPVKPGK